VIDAGSSTDTFNNSLLTVAFSDDGIFFVCIAALFRFLKEEKRSETSLSLVLGSERVRE
jgi:hypothetical protein